MDRLKSLEFLQKCINTINDMSVEKTEEMRQIYEEEMKVPSEVISDFEVVLSTEMEMGYSAELRLDNKKCVIDYNTPKYESVSTNFIECMAA